jgi:MFS family permease
MGIGLGLTFLPSASIVTHYFRRRRALAGGIALSGSAVGGLIFPISESIRLYYLMYHLNDKHCCVVQCSSPSRQSLPDDSSYLAF